MKNDTKPIKQNDKEVQKIRKQLNITSAKKEYQVMWKVMFVFITIVAGVLAHKIYLFQTLSDFDDVRKGYLSDFVLYGIPFAFLFSVFDTFLHSLLDKWVQNNYLTLKRYTDPISKKKRSYTIVKWSYSLVYYFFTSTLGIFLIKETSLFPQYLGGTGSSFNLAEERHLREATFGMKIYYLIQFGKHFSRFFGHVFIRPEGNFYEYVLHHGLSTFLIIYSYIMNMWLIGIFVLVIHDYTDFGLILARAYKDYRHRRQWLLTIFYINATVSWIVLRIFVFNYSCVYAPWYQILVDARVLLSPIEMYVTYIPYMFMCLMLTGLEVMHLFWTYFIISSFLEVNISQKVGTHNYD